MSYKTFEEVVLIKESFGYPAGTLCVFVGYTYDSGYHVAEVAVVDEQMKNFLNKNRFYSLKEYIDYQERENIFGSKYWTNPFNLFKPYESDLKSLSQIHREIKEKEEQHTALKQEMAELNKLKRHFYSKMEQ